MPPVVINKESVVVPDKVPLTILASDANVMAPDHVFWFLIFFIDPWFVPPTDTPLPLMVIGSAIFKPLPSICTVVPEATVVVPVAVPNAVLFFASITPLVKVVNPE